MLPVAVRAVCDSILAAVPPDLVAGLHLRGGIGFGEFVPGQSDVDFVAVLSRRPTAVDVAALVAAHQVVAEAHATPFDGMHVLASDLAADPRRCVDVPTILHGHFEAEGRLDPEVAWHELAWHGVTVLGPGIRTLDVWTDLPTLLGFTRDNLDTYWRSTAEALVARPAEGARADACCWCVLGVVRLHHLLVTGAMTTKSGAGRWGLGHYEPRFHRVLHEALRIREGGPDEYDDDAARRGHDTTALVTHVVARTVGGPW